MKFKKGDLQRVFFVLGAVEAVDRATLKKLVEVTGMPKSSISDTLNRLLEGQVPGLIIEKRGPVYSIENWGEIINKFGAKSFFERCKDG